MQKFITSIFIAVFIAVLILPLMIFAKIGVGIGTGRIEINEPLRPGGIYDLPSLSIVNTGDEPSDYGVRITYHGQYPELKPAEEWFSFSPSSFRLEPGQSQTVAVKLSLPIKGVEPGDYFCFLQAHPVVKSEEGITIVSIAAASKLYFTIIPANIWWAMYYRLLALWTRYSPWPQVIIGVISATIIIFILWKFFRRYFSFQIGLKKETKSKDGLKTNLESDLGRKPKRKPKRKQRQTK